MKQVIKKILPSSFIKWVRRFLSYIGKWVEFVPADALILQQKDKHVFFGYYDVTPFNNDDRYVLAHMADTKNVSPHSDNPEIDIGYYDTHQENPEFICFGKTDTWNWQQGARLQWFFDKDNSNNNLVIYNKEEGGEYVAIIQNPFTGEIVKKLSKPIYSVSPDGSYALSLDFDRLHDCRPGYGYNHFPHNKRTDIITHINIDTSDTIDLMNIDDVISFQNTPTMENANHYLNHLSISPSGTRFMVTHLWISRTGKRYSRLLVSDINHAKEYICPNNNGHTSHYSWLGDDRILIFGTHKGEASQYHLYNLTNSASEVIGKDALKEDGHPTWLNNEDLITDTYPDLLRRQNLLHFNTTDNTLKKLASIHTPYDFQGEVRCDLHPRINNGKTQICLDIIRKEHRALCIITQKKGEPYAG